MLVDDLEVGRVIARPFEGTPGNFKRTSRRKDCATLPPHTILDGLTENGIEVHAVGKIWDIFAEKGFLPILKQPITLKACNKPWRHSNKWKVD